MSEKAPQIDVNAAFDPELRQAQADMNAYLESRPYQDQNGRVHDPNTSAFINPDKYFDDRRQAAADKGEGAIAYEDMSAEDLFYKFAEAERAGDKTIMGDVREIALAKLSSDEVKLSDLANAMAGSEYFKLEEANRLTNEALDKKIVAQHNKNLGLKGENYRIKGEEHNGMTDGALRDEQLRARVMKLKDQFLAEIEAEYGGGNEGNGAPGANGNGGNGPENGGQGGNGAEQTGDNGDQPENTGDGGNGAADEAEQTNDNGGNDTPEVPEIPEDGGNQPENTGDEAEQTNDNGDQEDQPDESINPETAGPEDAAKLMQEFNDKLKDPVYVPSIEELNDLAKLGDRIKVKQEGAIGYLLDDKEMNSRLVRSFKDNIALNRWVINVETQDAAKAVSQVEEAAQVKAEAEKKANKALAGTPYIHSYATIEKHVNSKGDKTDEEVGNVYKQYLLNRLELEENIDSNVVPRMAAAVEGLANYQDDMKKAKEARKESKADKPAKAKRLGGRILGRLSRSGNGEEAQADDSESKLRAARQRAADRTRGLLARFRGRNAEAQPVDHEADTQVRPPEAENEDDQPAA